jgi:phenylacetate-CoA ligase
VTIHPTVSAFLKTMRETQYLPPRRLRAYQHRQLARLLAHARSETEFYPERLAPIFRSDGSIDWTRWHEVPVLTREKLQDHSPSLTARNIPKEAGATSTFYSSGSTGRRIGYQTTDIQLWASICANERSFDWHRIDPAKPAALIAAGEQNDHVELGKSEPSPGWRFPHPESVGIRFNIRNPVAEQIAWLEATRPAYLLTYPTNLREIARVARDTGKMLALEAVLTHGEMCSEATRGEISDYFGHAPVDSYGSTEGGFLASTCPNGSGHHVAADLVHVEILKEDGSDAEPGQAGRVVITPFYGFAMPLIRYDTGDWAMLDDHPCPCGRSLPILRHILGRSRNMFRFSDGSRVWPVLVSSVVQKYVPHRQFQVVQTAVDVVEYRYVPIASDQPIDLDGFVAFARRNLHPNVKIAPIAVSAIPRPENGKYEDYVSLVA